MGRNMSSPDNQSSQEHTPSSEATRGRWSDRANAKAKIVQPLLDLHPIPLTLMAEARRQAAQLLNKPDVPPQTIYNWIAKARDAGGTTALERKPRSDRGQSSLHPRLRDFVMDLLLAKERYLLAEVERRAVAEAQRLITEEGETIAEAEWPTYEKIRFLDAQISEAAKKHGREGARAQRNTHELVGRFEAEHRNQIWQCDHHLLDILVMNPETNKPERPWMTAIIDDHSRALLGIYLSFEHPSSNNIALALHHALLPKARNPAWIMHGIPSIFYCDNGKDYRSKHISEVCLHFRVELRFHEPYLARSKGKIERWFRTLKDMCLRYLDGYIGGNPKERPTNVTHYPALEQLRVRIEHFIVDQYHERMHSATRMTPRERWEACPVMVRQIEHLDDVNYLLESRSRIVQNDGIRFDNQRYVDREGALTEYIGTQVHVFFDRNDKSSIRVYHRDHYICTAYCNMSPSDIAESSKQVRQQMGQQSRESHRRSQAARQRHEEQATASGTSSSPVSSPGSQSQPGHQTDSQTERRRRTIIRYDFEVEEFGEDEE
jgi:putative transposase